MNAIVNLPVPIGTHQSLNALVPASIQEAINLSNIMADASLMPEHLRGKPGDCLLVVMQAQRWGMDALSVAQCTSVVRGKLCYEGKLVAAVLYSMGAVEGRLRYDLGGSGGNRTVRVTGRPRGGEQDESVEGSVQAWATDNGNWKKDPDSMLVYRGTRQWARRYAPEALLGVYTPEEFDDADVPPPAASRPAMPKARVIEHQAATTADDVTNSEPAAEPGMHLASAGQIKLLTAKAKNAGFVDDAGEFDESALLARFPRIDTANINDVLAQLQKLAEAQDAS